MKKIWYFIRLVFYIPAFVALIVATIFFGIAFIFSIIAGIDTPLEKFK